MKLIEFFLLASQHVVAQNKLYVVSYLHLTHTLKTDVNNGHRSGRRQGTKSPSVCFHPNRLGWRGQQCAEKMVRMRWKGKLSQSPVTMRPQDKGVITTLDLLLFFKGVCIYSFIFGCARSPLWYFSLW